METIELCAWHESGRVVYAYKNGYTCDAIELSETDAGGGKSKLNGGEDTTYINAILSGKTQAIVIENQAKAIDIARKLMKVYCAGSCAKIYMENDKQLNSQTEIDIPGQDLKYLELIQQFLYKHVPDHPEDFLNDTMTGIFRDMSKEETWKPIEMLVKQLLKADYIPFTRFNIEDALMVGGFKLQKQKTGNNSFGFSVKEDKAPSKELEVPYSVNEARLDNTLTEFLKMIKTDWSDEELNVSIQYLKSVFKKYADQ